MLKKLLNNIKGNDNQLISESTETPEQEYLTICRDSVCLADDIEDHHIKMSPLEENTYLNIFKAVNDSRYLPKMTSEKQFWAMVVKDKGEIKDEKRPIDISEFNELDYLNFTLILATINVGEAVALDSVERFTRQLEEFVNSYAEKHEQYKAGLIAANEAYSHENLIKAILK